MIKEATEVKKQGRPFLLFPEGTRRAVGAIPDYKSGVYILYKELNVPVIPVAHNAGVFWKKNSLVKESGTVIFEFLPPIEAGLSKDEFMTRMVNAIETKTNLLVDEALNKKGK